MISMENEIVELLRVSCASTHWRVIHRHCLTWNNRLIKKRFLMKRHVTLKMTCRRCPMKDRYWHLVVLLRVLAVMEIWRKIVSVMAGARVRFAARSLFSFKWDGFCALAVFV